ncbi:MAG: hypothetical protein AAFR61_05355 [Bacteroidota bacterium]
MKIIFTCCLIMASLFAHAQSSPAGIWNTGKDNTKIEIAEGEQGFEGKILSSDHADAPLGKLLLKEIKQVEGAWKGKLFAAKKGEWMDAILQKEGDQLVITVGNGWMSKEVTWSLDKKEH